MTHKRVPGGDPSCPKKKVKCPCSAKTRMKTKRMRIRRGTFYKRGVRTH